LLYTTHYMEEAERLADRVVIIDHGRVIANESVDRLRGSLSPTASVSLEEVFLSLTGRSLRD
jgi:ABC-2 type transport system ATP-binding protein